MANVDSNAIINNEDLSESSDEQDETSDEQDSHEDNVSDPEKFSDLELEKDDVDEQVEPVPDIVADKNSAKSKAILLEYATNSSCHGLPHLATANTWPLFLFWLVVLIFCFCAFVYLFWITLSTYLRFDKVVSVKVDNGNNLFPGVTICNINPYKKSELHRSKELRVLAAAFNLVTKRL